MAPARKGRNMKKTAPLFVLTAGILWGSMGIFVRGLDAYDFTSMEIVALRMMGALLFLGCGVFLYDRKLLIIKWKDIWCFLGTGIISVVFFNFCYFSTIKMTSLSVAATMLYTAPAIVTVFGIFLFHESFHLLKLVSLLLAFGGCVCVTGILAQSQPLSAAGILLGLGSGFGYAMYSVFGHYALEKGYHSLTINVYTFLFGSIGVMPFIRVSDIVRKAAAHPSCAGLILGLIVLNTIAAYLTYTIGLSHMEAGKASILASVEPVAATMIGFFLYKEKPDMMTWIGVALVLASVSLVSMIPERRRS